MKLHFGQISEVDETKSLYRVELDELEIVTDWLPRVALNFMDNIDEAHFDVNEHVLVILDEFLDHGGILGAITDETVTIPSGSNKDIRRTVYKDGSFIAFNRNSGTYEVNVKGDVMVTATGKIQLNGTGNNGIVKAPSLKTKLNNLENIVNSLVTKFNSHTHILTLTSGTGTAAPTVVPETGVLVLTNEPEIRNDKVVH